MVDGKKTFIGAFVIFCSLIAREQITETEATQVASAIVELAGLIYVVYGRYQAKKIY